jgi:hypothetical protein
MATSDNTPPSEEAERNAGIFEALGPRMASAKRSYMRKRVTWLFAMPLVLGAGAAWAATASPERTTQVASAPQVIEIPADAAFVDEPDSDTGTDLLAKGGATVDTPSSWQSVDLGTFGSVEVTKHHEAVVLGETELPAGWAVEVWSSDGDEITLILTNDDETLLVTIHHADEGFVATVDEVLKPAPTPEPTPEPTKKPAPVVETRKEINVFDVGKVVVEREGSKLWLGIKWSAEGYTPHVLVENGTKVKAKFAGDQYIKYVEAWIEGSKIKSEVWYDVVQPEFQTQKELSVYDKGHVFVQRAGDSNVLSLTVTWHHDWWAPVVVTAEGAEVHAYFTNDGVEKHIVAWTEGALIKHEIWVVEPASPPYDGLVVCEFGTVSVLVEGNVAQVTDVAPADGVTYEIIQNNAEIVKVRYTTATEVWLIKAWGNGTEVEYLAIDETPQA